MSKPKIEERVAILEAEVAQLKHQLEIGSASVTPWWEKISGTFANDPASDEAIELGRKYRQSLRPTNRKNYVAR